MQAQEEGDDRRRATVTMEIVEFIIDKTDGSGVQRLNAVDFNGTETGLYIEAPPPPEEQSGWKPVIICPECINNTPSLAAGRLRQGQGVGPNNSILFHCPVCEAKFARSDRMPSGIYLEMN